jgi:hypothetical protein
MRIRSLEPKEIPWTARPILAVIRRVFGRVLTPYTVYARKPGILWASFVNTVALDRARSVPRGVKFLVSLRAAQMIGCPF